jgi:hypothetical protein
MNFYFILMFSVWCNKETSLRFCFLTDFPWSAVLARRKEESLKRLESMSLEDMSHICRLHSFRFLSLVFLKIQWVTISAYPFLSSVGVFYSVPLRVPLNISFTVSPCQCYLVVFLTQHLYYFRTWMLINLESMWRACPLRSRQRSWWTRRDADRRSGSLTRGG